MATIYAASTDASLYTLVNAADSWNKTRHNVGTAGTSANAAATLYYMAYVRRYGSTKHAIIRGIMAFDTSGISVAPDSATLKLYPGSGTGNDIVVVKVDASATIDLSSAAVAGDYDKIAGFSASNTMAGNATDYSARPKDVTAGVSAWTTGEYNDVALSAACLSDMASLSVLKLMIVEYDHDYLNVEPGTVATWTGFYGYYQNQTGTDKDPYIDYVAGAASGWGGTDAGKGKKCGAVVAGDAKQFIGVATANTGKILGV